MLVKRQQQRTRGGGKGSNGVSQNLKTGRTLASLFPKGKRIAVIFACDDYAGAEHDGKRLKDLHCAVKDAELFRDTIKEAGFEIFSYKVNAECTRDSMQEVLDDVINRFDDVTNAQFIFYYAGHGVKDRMVCFEQIQQQRPSHKVPHVRPDKHIKRNRSHPAIVRSGLLPRGGTL